MELRVCASFSEHVCEPVCVGVCESERKKRGDGDWAHIFTALSECVSTDDLGMEHEVCVCVFVG